MFKLLENQELVELTNGQPIYLESQTIFADGENADGRTYFKIHDGFEVVYVMECRKVYSVYPTEVDVYNVLDGTHSPLGARGNGFFLDVLTDVTDDVTYIQVRSGEDTGIEAKVGDTTCQQWYITSIENDVYTLTRGGATHVLDAKVVPPWVFTTYGLHSEEFWTWQR